MNQYTAIGAIVPAYDTDGNATSYPLPVAATVNSTLVWDAENRLIEVKNASSVSLVTYQYDYLGRRTLKNVTVAGGGTGSNVTFVYDGWNPIVEYTGTTLSKSYTWGMDLSGSMQGAGGVGGLLAVKDGTSTYYPTFDGNGNVSEYLDSTGVVQAHYEYDAFGNTLVSNGTKVNDFAHRFSTKPLDAETGLYYYGYRYYDATVGRFINRDPIGENGGDNLYAFVGNDAANKVDVLGRKPTLSGAHVDLDLGDCGNFEWVVAFVYGPLKEDQRTGIILQEVEFEGFYQEYDQFGVLKKEKHQIAPKTNPYHEVWDASDFGDETSDSFSYEGKGINTMGELTITGWARYYPNLDHDDKASKGGEYGNIGWTNSKATNGTWAGGGQWAGERNPGWLAAGATASALYKHSIKIRWDCCEKTNETIEVEKEF